MKYSSYVLLLILMGCSASKEVNKQTTKSKGIDISKLIFRHYHSITEEGDESFNILQDSLIAAVKREPEVDSLAALELMSFSIIDVLKATPETEIHLELYENIVWKYTTEYGKMIGDFQRIDTDNGILFYHAKSDKSKMYRQVELSENNDNYSIKEFLDDKKEIMGYSCYKVIVRQKEQAPKDDFPLKFGDTIYEMYVTPEIDLPAYALLGFPKRFSNFFPLDIKITTLKGVNEIYEIQDIIKDK